MASRRIPGGDLGTLATLAEMRGAVNRGVRNPLTVDLAGLIVQEAGNYRPSQIGAIRSWLGVSVRFLPDPYGVETLREVPEMLGLIQRFGIAQIDCDDVAILGAALGNAVGLAARFVVLGFHHPAAPYRHVFTELFDGQRWRELDLTRPHRMPPTLRMMRVPV